MAVVRGQATLSGGTIVRIVDAGAGQTPRYTIEAQQNTDAMGVVRWYQQSGFSHQDVVDILRAVGFIP